MLTQSRLHKLFKYLPETGELFRKIKAGNQQPGIKAGCLAQGYYKLNVDGKLYLLHRIVWLYVYGELPEFIDHINRISTDNRIVNLRSVTKAQNQQNKNVQKNNKAGYKGIHWDKQRSKWFVCINHQNKTIGLGRYKTAIEALEAYKQAAKIYHTHNPSAI
jgi:hypothetical protein